MTLGEDGLIARVIRSSLANPALVLFVAALLATGGLWALRSTPVDALPDLSDVQVIIRTSFPGQAPRVVEDQVTYPLTTALLSVPGTTSVRGYSVFGDSFIHVLFRDGTDPYWARARVLESLRRSEARLPAGAQVELGPDATGVGWIFEYALLDRTGQHDLAELRALQDWFLKFELQSLDDIAEVATLGGMVKEYQVVVDPDKLRAYGIALTRIRAAIEGGNRESGGSVIELAEAEYMVRATGYIRGIEDLRRIPVQHGDRGRPILLGDLADVRLGPAMRRGIADLNGEGEVVGGVIVARYGANAQRTIDGVKARLAQLRPSLPKGVEIVATYDRSTLIERAIGNLWSKLAQEFAVVLLVCLLFLHHLRSGLAIVVVLPLGILASFLVMRAQGINANIMSLGGIAIAVGVMVDAAIVMTENVHKRLESAAAGDGRQRLAAIAAACTEVGPVLFMSLLIVAVSFVPVLALEAQEGRLFAPLAYTKTYAMIAAALASITVVPVLILLLVRAPPRPERDNPVNRVSAAFYRPLLAFVLRQPGWTVAGSLAIVLATLWPATRLGSEFMPDIDEGDLLYMPTTLPGISADAARALLQRTDRLIHGVPEVERVFGKAGRADTATDPAPLEMLETIVQLKPRGAWRDGLTLDELKAQLDERVRLPGLANSWIPPIKARIDMLSTGIRSTLAVKLSGPEPQRIEQLGERIAEILRAVPGAASVFAERVSAGRYIEVDVDRVAAARYGLNMDDVHDVVRLAIGGEIVGESVEARERYPISVRYPQEWRDSVERLRTLPVVVPGGAQIVLGDVARLSVAEGPAMIRSEDARPAGWVSIEVRERDLGSFVSEAQRQIDAARLLPAGYSLRWSGQYEYLERALGRLKLIVPLALAVIVLLLYLNFRRPADVFLILGCLPVALVGAVWLLWALGYHMNVAVAVGCIALAGLAIETGVVMLLYLNTAWSARLAAKEQPTREDLREAIVEGALLRLRPKLMTVMTIMAGLLPLLFGNGAGSEVMQHIAAPMIGGMLSAMALTLLVIPAVFLLAHRRSLPPPPFRQSPAQR